MRSARTASISSGQISPISETSNDHAKTRAGTWFRRAFSLCKSASGADSRQQHARDQSQAAHQGDGLPWLFVKVGVGVRECGAGTLAHGLMRVIQTRPRGIEALAQLR